MLDHFSARKNLVKAVERTVRHWTLTPEGQAVSSDELQETVVITDLTPELLQGMHGKRLNSVPLMSALKPQHLVQDAAIPCRHLSSEFVLFSLRWAFLNSLTIMFNQLVGTWTLCLFLKTIQPRDAGHLLPRPAVHHRP